MKIFIRIFFLLLLTSVFSCEDSEYFVNCSDCSIQEPMEASLIIRFSDTGGMPVQIRIFEGELQDSILYHYSEYRGTEVSISVSLNKLYTITATYYIGDKKYIAIDSATPRVKYTDDQCEDPCYFLYDRITDLSLKYTVR